MVKALRAGMGKKDKDVHVSSPERFAKAALPAGGETIGRWSLSFSTPKLSVMSTFRSVLAQPVGNFPSRVVFDFP
jgi:hypothetical protein